ncbi:MAG: AbrB/MazE/SpoVT family DNA-binding domain-containing protein [Anaerolineae bacterium]|nr:AbrB/MazE/SpoVT family DNA-binding domain-containing protein [Anaerolineae bacterium]NIN95260.1 AbrB/MazE/SpoVT family DNA-binding domain-containing protein [Anaerolineae bacterium]NIQ78225.1 AbrB/MazE/SpoVT family DNA-binding domain-containing protein [Anaerolineae bacterium]
MERTGEVRGPLVVQVRERGQFTIPAEIRRQMGIEEGDVFSLIQVGDTLVATRKKLVAPEIAGAIEAIMQEEGVTLADLLEGLEEQRRTYVREKYGIEA